MVVDIHAAVAFKIGFVDHIKPQLVAQRVKLRRVRIVRGAHGVDVVQLHQGEVAAHFCGIRVISGVGIAVMAVHAEYLDMAAVELQNAAADADLAESRSLADDLVVGLYRHTVEIRSLRGPQLYVIHAAPERLAVLGCSLTELVLTVVQRDSRTAAADGHGENTVFVYAVGHGGDVVVCNALFRAGQHVDITEDAGQPELVLIFEIRSVAPFEHSGGYIVFSLAKQVGNIELRGVVGNLRVSRKRAVHKQVQTAVHSLKAEYASHSVRLVDIAPAIDAHRIVVRNIRRVIRYGVADVRVLRLVVAVKLPVRRNRYCLAAPLRIERVVRVDYAVAVCEIPVPVKELQPGRLPPVGKGILPLGKRDKITVRRECPLVQYLRVFVVSEPAFA